MFEDGFVHSHVPCAVSRMGDEKSPGHNGLKVGRLKSLNV
jgi:hypothetical protein